MAPLFGGFPFIPDDEGYLTFRLPYLGGDGTMSWIDLESDYGDIVHATLLEPEKYNGQQIEAISCIARLEDLVTMFERGLSYHPIHCECIADKPHSNEEEIQICWV